MKNRVKPILAALLASGLCGSCGISQAAIVGAAPDAHQEARTVIIERELAFEPGSATGMAFERSHLAGAQSEPGNVKKEVKIITSGSHINMSDLADMPDVNVIVSNAMSEAFSGSMSMPMAKNVKNAPYSAEVISEKIQSLPDGNQISRKTSTLAFRDSAGRTRQETRDSKGEVKAIHINETVEGVRYVISPSKKTATRLTLDKDLHKHIEEIKEKARASAKDGKVQVIERHMSGAPGTPGEEIIVKRIEVPGADGKKEVREEVKVHVMRSNAGSGNAAAHAVRFEHGESIGRAISESMRHGPIGMSFQDGKWAGKSATTPLGSKDFDGVRADGKSTSYTIPAGEIGNRNPIVVSTETWTSPDLQVVVYSRHSDPRVGDTIYRLANVKRSEQPATLFMVPEGYSVKELPGPKFSSKTK